MGGAVASLLAASHPELVERCVFIDILGPYASNPGTSPKQLRASIASKGEMLEQHYRTPGKKKEQQERRAEIHGMIRNSPVVALKISVERIHSQNENSSLNQLSRFLSSVLFFWERLMGFS